MNSHFDLFIQLVSVFYFTKTIGLLSCLIIEVIFET